jgi:hypothetical protein
MLKKPDFDCAKLGDFYDCGCADDEEDESADRSGSESEVKAVSREDSVESVDSGNISPVEISREPLVLQPLDLALSNMTNSPGIQDHTRWVDIRGVDWPVDT